MALPRSIGTTRVFFSPSPATRAPAARRRRAFTMSQPTIGRRLAAFEAAFGGPALFDLPGGLAPQTPPARRAQCRRAIGKRRLQLSEPRGPAASRRRWADGGVSVGEWGRGSSPAATRSDFGDAAAVGIIIDWSSRRRRPTWREREADLAVRHHPPEGGDLYVARIGTFAAAVYPGASERMAMPG
jgi:hypothetical protein